MRRSGGPAGDKKIRLSRLCPVCARDGMRCWTGPVLRSPAAKGIPHEEILREFGLNEVSEDAGRNGSAVVWSPEARADSVSKTRTPASHNTRFQFIRRACPVCEYVTCGCISFPLLAECKNVRMTTKTRMHPRGRPQNRI